MSSLSRSSKREPSVSRHSRRGSSVSRRQSLIHKSTAPHDLRPSDVLIDRFAAWKDIVKQLVDYFEHLAHIEHTAAKEYTKLSAIIQVPFRAASQFVGEAGIQDIYYGVRDKTRAVADQHANLARIVDSAIVQHLQRLHTEIKAHIKSIQNDTGKLADGVTKERELSTRAIAELTTSVTIFKNTPMSVTHKTDPYVANIAVIKQLQKQVHEENALQESLIIMQHASAQFEQAVIRGVQSAWQTFEEWRSRMADSVHDIWRTMDRTMAALPPDREWTEFSTRSDHLLDPDTPLRNPDTIHYPSKDERCVSPVHTGMLERKKRFTRAYREAYYVLTPAGFLHEFATSDPFQPGTSHTPVLSLFLPECTLGPPSTASAKSHKFYIEGQKDGAGTVSAASASAGAKRRSSFRLPVVGARRAWSFRFRSHDDMMEWWDDVRTLCARCLVASAPLERRGIVEDAVRCAGYTGEEDEADDRDGSSDEHAREGEDEEEEEEGEEEFQDALADIDEEGADQSKDAVKGKDKSPPPYSNGSRNRNPSPAKMVRLNGIAHEYREPSTNANGYRHQGRLESARAQQGGSLPVPPLSNGEPRGAEGEGGTEHGDTAGPAPPGQYLE